MHYKLEQAGVKQAYEILRHEGYEELIEDVLALWIISEPKHWNYGYVWFAQLKSGKFYALIERSEYETETKEEMAECLLKLEF